jgi:dihydroxyacid dehydratase/phosphogluconate dehydratase
MDELSRVVPLIASVYPNGAGDVNYFHAAGGMPYVIRELLESGLAHADIRTVYGQSLAEGAQEPVMDGETLRWTPRQGERDRSMLRPWPPRSSPKAACACSKAIWGAARSRSARSIRRAGRSRRRSACSTTRTT